DGTMWPDRDFSLPRGQHTAGHAIGILLLDDFYWPFMPGDMANATTFEFPVLHHVVRGSTLAQVKQADTAVGTRLVAAHTSGLAETARQRELGCINPHRYAEQLVALAQAHLDQHPDIAAIVAEYTEFPTFAWAVQHAVKVPIFDCTTLTRWLHSGVVRRPFAGII
ncbi:MAG: hypothetical protein ACI8W7_004743, partial [Gammaproteobacteria bacterium]